MDKRDKQLLIHIKSHCKDIDDFIKRFGDSFDTFIKDRAYYNSVCLSILQIGECANKLSEEYRESTKDSIPWGLIRGTRNWVAHGYNELDERTIWDTAKDDIPKLHEFCEAELSVSPELDIESDPDPTDDTDNIDT